MKIENVMSMNMMSMSSCGGGYRSTRSPESDDDEEGEEINPMEGMGYESEGVVNRFARVHSCSIEGSKILFEQTKMFLVTCATAKKPFAPSVVIDEMWHIFVLHMKEYEEFSDKMGVMVYHVPTEPHLRPGLIRPTSELLEEARKLFGKKIDKDLWPDPDEKRSASDLHGSKLEES